MSKFLVIVAAVLLVAACQTSQRQTQYYQLANTPQTMSVSSDVSRLIIEPVILVDFLKRPNILLKQANNTLYVTNYHVWAEPLDKAIARAMVNIINQESLDLRAERKPLAICKNHNCYNVRIYVEAFYPLHSSQVEFSGKYIIERGNILVHQQDFNLVSELTSDGYPHAVSKLATLIAELSSQITHKVTTIPLSQ